MSADVEPSGNLTADTARRRIKAAVIDLDGTMIDTADDFTASLNGMLAELGARPVSRDEVVGYVGKGSEHLVRSGLSARFSAMETDARFADALDRYQRHYGDVNGRHTRLYADVEQGLAALAQAGVKLAKQSYDLIPNVIKAGGDGMYGPSILQGAGFPSADGWYATVASPHMMEDSELQPWVKRFTAKTGRQPSDYSITAYDAALVVINAIERVAASGKPVERVAVRDALRHAECAGHRRAGQGLRDLRRGDGR